MQGEHGVGRVIARPFVGEPGGFTRTPNRRDFSLEPPQDTILDKLTAAGYPVWAVGKIEDIFAGRGINRAVHTKNNQDTVNATLTYMRELQQPGLIFANLVDFDMLWSQRPSRLCPVWRRSTPACRSCARCYPTICCSLSQITAVILLPTVRTTPENTYHCWLTGITHHTATTWAYAAPSPMWLRRWPLFSKWITLVRASASYESPYVALCGVLVTKSDGKV